MLRTLLRIYFWAICLLIITLTIIDFDDGIPMEWKDYVDWIFSIISLSGVYAYCYSKPFLTAVFWRVFLPILMAWDLFFVMTSSTEDPSIFSTDDGFIILSIIVFIYIVLLAPSYIALYLLPKEFERNESFVMKA